MLGDDQGELVDGEEETEEKKKTLQMVGDLGDFFFFFFQMLFFCFKRLQKFSQLKQKIPSSTGAVEEMLLMLMLHQIPPIKNQNL